MPTPSCDLCEHWRPCTDLRPTYGECTGQDLAQSIKLHGNHVLVVRDNGNCPHFEPADDAAWQDALREESTPLEQLYGVKPGVDFPATL